MGRICKKRKVLSLEWMSEGMMKSGDRVDGTDRGSTTHKTRWVRIGGLTERNRELIPETRGSILKERCRKDDVDGRASVTKDEEGVLRGGWTVMRICKYEGWIVDIVQYDRKWSSVKYQKNISKYKSAWLCGCCTNEKSFFYINLVLQLHSWA